MNQINFLPDSYFRERRRTRRVYGEFGLLGVVVLLLGVMGVASSRNVSRLMDHHATVAHDTEILLTQVNQKARLSQLQKELVRQVKLQRNLTIPLNHTDVIDALASTMPKTMAITQFAAITPSPELKLPEVKKPSRRSRKKSRSKEADNKPMGRKPHEVMQVELVGLCPTDIEIANFVGRLAEHRLFDNVKLQFSRSTVVDGHLARAYRVEMEVYLDRAYLPREQRNQEVASAH